ncbi:MAG: GGDEF domain-containing protein [Candidatus Aenigmarchaeota archaeon]|nr:GGDEF domain-containing protein [Candidatus Aenigmarchaeota archaeon]
MYRPIRWLADQASTAFTNIIDGVVARNPDRYPTVKKFKDESIYDTPTAVHSKGYFLSTLAEDLSRLPAPGEIRAHPEYSKTIIIVDVVGLGEINDKYNQVVGDKVLRYVTDTLKRSVRSGDVIGRYGGDEFAVQLPNATEEDARHIIGRIAQNFSYYKFRLPDDPEILDALRGGRAGEDSERGKGLVLRLGHATTYQPCDMEYLLKKADPKQPLID